VDIAPGAGEDPRSRVPEHRIDQRLRVTELLGKRDGLLDYWIARVPSPDNEARVVAAIAAARAILAGPPEPTNDQRILAARLLGKAARKWSLSGRADVAIDWAEQAVPLAQELGDPQALIDAMLGHKTARIFTGARGDVHGWVRSGNRGAVAHQLENIAFALIARGSVENAARLLGAAAILRESAHSPMIQSEHIEFDDWMARLRASGDNGPIDAALAAGGRLSMAEAVAAATTPLD